MVMLVGVALVGSGVAGIARQERRLTRLRTGLERHHRALSRGISGRIC